MKKRRGILLSMVMICIILLCACGREEKISVSEQFIQLVFTSNADGRYEKFMETDMEDEENLQAAVDTYYKDFEELVSEEYLLTMKANRIPLSYDKAAMEQNAKVTIENISLEAESDCYEYTVILREQEDGQTEERICTGQIKTIVENGKEKISFFSCNESAE